MTRRRWKNNIARSKYSDAKTLALLLIFSCAAHVAFLLLVPSFALFPPSEYIEIDMIDIGQTASGENADEHVAESDFQPPRIPEETPPAVETGLSALEWEALAPQSAGDLRAFQWQTPAKSEPVAPETMPRADNLTTAAAIDKEQPESAARESMSEPLIDDAVTSVEQPPRQADERAETPEEPAFAAPSEAVSLMMPEAPPVSAVPQNSRTLPAERLDVERETWSRPEPDRASIQPVRLPETKVEPEFDQREAFQVDVPTANRSSAPSEPISLQEDMPTIEKVSLPAPSIATPEPMLTAQVAQAARPTLPERERLEERVIRPNVQAEASQEKAVPVEHASDALPVPTAARNVQETPAAEQADELLPPQPLSIRPRISENDERIAHIPAMPTARPLRPAIQESGRLPARTEPIIREPAFPAATDVSERTETKAQPNTSDEIEQVTREKTPQEESVQIEGPAAARQVRYRPSRLPSVTLDRDVTIRLKFWVLPDGTVGEVIPLQRGDIRLEQAAIQYVKSWRFTPISGSETVWGIIPVKYRLK